MARDWTLEARGILRAEMARRSLTYAGLSEKLGELDVKETENSLRSKFSRASFTAGFFLSCLAAMEVKRIYLDESE